MAAAKVCCVPACSKSRADDIVLHKFPNPSKDRTRFLSWVQAVGGNGNLLCLDDMYVFKYRRICQMHFESKYCTRSKYLSNIAIPTLQMKGVVKRAPLTEVTNKINTPEMQEMATPSTSSLQVTDSTSNLKVTKSEKTKMNKKILTLKKKVRTLNMSSKKYSIRLKKAMNLSENKTFLKSIQRFTTMAAIFTVLQFHESGKKKMGRRFTHDEKVMALHLYKRGPRVYRFLKNLFILPSPFTLSRMISRANIKAGINENIFKQLKKQASKMKNDNKLCTLLFDEMALTPHIDYDRKNDKLIGLVDNGDVVKPEIADHVLVFMIRGILKNYKQAISFTFCAGSTNKAELASMIKKNIRKLKEAGFKVLATVCDQGTSNVSAINYLIEQTRANYAREGKEAREGVFEVDNDEIIPLFDVPHLIKGIRNNLLTKNLKYTMEGTERIAKWDHIKQLYENNPTYKGIRLIKKLTESHCDPKKIPKMKVKHATQIFSHTVGVNMGYLADQGLLSNECKDTADVLLFFDNLFDSMNGSFNNSSKRSGKPLLLALTPKSEHQRVWRQSKLVLKSMKFISNKGLGVVPSLSNWIRTIDNMEKLKNKLFNVYKIKSIWCRHFNQDPLENFFGSIRSHGCRNNSPTCAGFESAFVSLVVNSLSSTYSPGSNCEEDSGYMFKSLKNLFFTENKRNNVPAEVEYEHIFNDEMIVDLSEKKKDPRIMAALEYVTGYLLKQCRTKVFKNCKSCEDNLYSTEQNNYIKLREYNKEKAYLSYPSLDLVKCFSEIQDIIYFIIKKNPETSNIKNYIKIILEVRLDFEYLKCDAHKQETIERIYNSSCIFFLSNWCRDVNKILNGTNTKYDSEDLLQCLASKYYNKRKRK